MAEPTAAHEPSLAGQTVVVIGGSAGIGLETARRAKAEGAEVVITGRDEGRLKQAAGQVGAQRTAAFDALDGSALGSFFEQFDGPIGHVLLSAGGPYYAPFADLDVADAMNYVSTHLAAPINVARYASPSDVAALAIHLMTNPVLTGATYDIDGGQGLL